MHYFAVLRYGIKHNVAIGDGGKGGAPLPEISIIVPIYNVEMYLEQCLRSAMVQTFQDIEIICVDDGSTDNSFNILSRLAKEDERIRGYRKENSGYGHTMNLGLELSKGKYVCFLESDDYILPDMCQRMYEVCEKYSLDFVKADCYKFFQDKGKLCSKYIPASPPHTYGRVLTQLDKWDIFFSPERYTWLCMYSLDFLRKYAIRHNESPGASYQDNGFFFQTVMYCQKVYFLKEAYYMYRLDNPCSSIHNGRKIHSLAGEFSFIRKKIGEFKGAREDLVFISAIQEFALHFWYFGFVEVTLMKDLALLMNDEAKIYFSDPLFDIRRLDLYYTKRILTCVMNPDLFCAKIMEERSRLENNRKILTEYPYVILYGAGFTAHKIREYIDELMLWHINLFCAVTTPRESKKYFDELEIKRIDDLVDYRNCALLILCVREDAPYKEEMKNNALRIGFFHIVDANSLLNNEIWEHPDLKR